MARFYGVYLNNTAISTVLDIIRFLGEPDAIRFSHITLRGPYADSGLTKARLQEINDRYQCGQSVTMIEPVNFFSERQFTVVVAVDLKDLKDLFYKPDFPDGIPHLTLYDGNSRGFAEAVFAIARRYVWGFSTGVGALRAIESKRHLDREFLPFFTSFCSLFQKLIGDPATITAVRSFSADHRLDLIQSVFEKCVEKTPPKPPRGVQSASGTHTISSCQKLPIALSAPFDADVLGEDVVGRTAVI